MSDKNIWMPLCTRAEFWISNNVNFISKSEKSNLEYLETELFSLECDDINESRYLKLVQYAQSLKDTTIDYRFVERIALDSILNEKFKLHHDKIRTVYNQTIMHNVLTGELPLAILADRDILYAITHTVFYATIFNHTAEYISAADLQSEKIRTMFENGLLLACRHDDIDVLVELVASVYILNLDNRLNEAILKVAYQKIEASQFANGSISPTGELTKPLSRQVVYHTTLAVKILESVLA